MTVLGTVRNGQIVISPGVQLPEGSDVEVKVIESESKPMEVETEPTLKGLLRFAGMITDLPADSSVNVDHYLYGAPKSE